MKAAADRPRGGARKSALTVLKLSWLVLVIAVAVWYGLKNAEGVAAALRALDPARLIVSFLVIGLVKATVTVMIVATLRRNGAPLGWAPAFQIYNATQIAKYIPGAIWHFVGRIYAYQRLNMTPGAIKRAILTENFWLLGGAVLTAGLFAAALVFIAPDASWLRLVADFLRPVASNWPLMLAVLVAGAGGLFVVVRYFRKGFFALLRAARPSPAMLACMVLTQVLLGLSLFVLVQGVSAEAPAHYVIAVSAIATGLGYIAFFAPAGLGVKDGLLIVLLAVYMPEEAAFLVVGVHRLLYIFMDLLLGVQANLAGAITGRAPPARSVD